MTQDPPPPSVFAYLDHRRFLDDWFTWKKSVNARYSHRQFARAAGTSSPSLLKHIIDGDRNLTSNTLPGFCKAMRLDREQAAFMGLLVDLDRAETAEERNAVMRRIQGTRHFQTARPLEGEGFRYLSTWYLPAIRELALCPGFRPDPAWVARQVRPRITEAEARDALDTLQTLGLLSVRDDGTVQVHDVTVVTPKEVSILAVGNYHTEMLERASASVEAIRADERHLLAITVAIPSSLVPELKQRMNRMFEELLETCDGATAEPDTVYQIGAQCFPLASRLDPSEEP